MVLRLLEPISQAYHCSVLDLPLAVPRVPLPEPQGRGEHPGEQGQGRGHAGHILNKMFQIYIYIYKKMNPHPIKLYKKHAVLNSKV